MELKIERGIPPPKGNQRHTGLIETLRKMKPGDSVLVKSFVSPRGTAVYCWGPGSVRCRREEDGFRLWRVK